MKSVYVSDDKKVIRGNISPFSGIRSIERKESGMVLKFRDDDSAYRVAQLLINSGYETVRIL